MSLSLKGQKKLTISNVFCFWLPLSASWLLMAVGSPTVNAFVARMSGAELQLAALGIALSLTIMIQGPIIILLTVSNAMARDRDSFRLLRRFTLGLIALLTAAMLLLSLTPLFDLVVLRLIGAPAEVAVLVRPALLAMILRPAAIAYRRFRQGVMIRYGYTRQVSYGTAIRTFTCVSVSALGLMWGKLDGAIVGALALTMDVMLEAVGTHYFSRPAVWEVEMVSRSPDVPAVTLRALLEFYLPLALTSMITLSTGPLINFALARSPHPILSLAAWPVVKGQVYIVLSFGRSFQEVVVALLGNAAAAKTLRRFAVMLVAGSLALLLVIAFTPLAPLWLQRIAGLSEELALFAIPALRLATLMPVLAVTQSWLRGVAITGKAVGAIAQATAINLAVLTTMLLVGAQGGWLPGASLAAVALTGSQLAECVWLWHGARPVRQQIGDRAWVRV